MRRLGSTAVVAVAMAVAGTATAHALPLPKTKQQVVVMAHPDDEVRSWSYYEQFAPDTYVVWITMTRGDGTDSCLRPEDAEITRASTAPHDHFLSHFGDRAGLENSSGPYKYEGPGSPVGEPDLDERHPFGNPWQGQRTEACKRARIASWHWFLDEMHRVDGTGADLGIDEDPWAADSFRGTFCPGDTLRCADVWATSQGARIAFDFSDQGYFDGAFGSTPNFSSEDVRDALKWVQKRRSRLGLPLLRADGVFTPASYTGPPCAPDVGELDHRTVHEALHQHDVGLGRRAGRMHCPTDRHAEGAEVLDQVMRPSTLVAINLVEPNTERRIGPFVRNYGWLFPGYDFSGCLPGDCLYWTKP